MVLQGQFRIKFRIRLDASDWLHGRSTEHMLAFQKGVGLVAARGMGLPLWQLNYQCWRFSVNKRVSEGKVQSLTPCFPSNPAKFQARG